jgi:hypothetical protein
LKNPISSYNDTVHTQRQRSHTHRLKSLLLKRVKVRQFHRFTFTCPPPRLHPVPRLRSARCLLRCSHTQPPTADPIALPRWSLPLPSPPCVARPLPSPPHCTSRPRRRRDLEGATTELPVARQRISRRRDGEAYLLAIPVPVPSPPLLTALHLPSPAGRDLGGAAAELPKARRQSVPPRRPRPHGSRAAEDAAIAKQHRMGSLEGAGRHGAPSSHRRRHPPSGGDHWSCRNSVRLSRTAPSTITSVVEDSAGPAVTP